MIHQANRTQRTLPHPQIRQRKAAPLSGKIPSFSPREDRDRMNPSPASVPTRREWLRAGGLGALGLGLPSLLRAEPGRGRAKGSSFGRAKSCVLLFLSGGPPQHDTFDPKPDAPAEVRGTIGLSIRSSVPGLHVSELLPRAAKQMHRVALIRSMTTDIHATRRAEPSCSRVTYRRARRRTCRRARWTGRALAATVGALNPNPDSPLSSVILPGLIYNNGNIHCPARRRDSWGRPGSRRC